MWCNGLNAAGFDLAPEFLRTHYTIPNKEAIRYFHNLGANCFRLPVTWERLQMRLGDSELDLVDGFEDMMSFITDELGDWVILDPHNNDDGLRHSGVDASASDFVALWIALARKWKDNPLVIFGLYNEPRYGEMDGVGSYFDPDAGDYNGVMIEDWRLWMQAAIDAIRFEVNATQLILVPGLHWTGCRDWSGAEWWGETIDGIKRGGNTRLAALTDPYNMIAYDVHQYVDGRFTGEETGCIGHTTPTWGVVSADQGLNMTIEWAKKFNKKLMMTEIGSFQHRSALLFEDQVKDTAACRHKLHRYLQVMHDSNVFLGYQVWQFGCDSCLGDLWSARPLNLDWYRFHDFGVQRLPAGAQLPGTPSNFSGDAIAPPPSPIARRPASNLNLEGGAVLALLVVGVAGMTLLCFSFTTRSYTASSHRLMEDRWMTMRVPTLVQLSGRSSNEPQATPTEPLKPVVPKESTRDSLGF